MRGLFWVLMMAISFFVGYVFLSCSTALPQAAIPQTTGAVVGDIQVVPPHVAPAPVHEDAPMKVELADPFSVYTAILTVCHHPADTVPTVETDCPDAVTGCFVKLPKDQQTPFGIRGCARAYFKGTP